MADTDLLCSMTAEPEPTREHLAERLSVLERELARAKQTILHLECERDELRAERDQLAADLEKARAFPGPSFELDRMRKDFDRVKAQVRDLADDRDKACMNYCKVRDERDALKDERDKLLSERDALKAECDAAYFYTQRVFVDVTGVDQVTSALKQRFGYMNPALGESFSQALKNARPGATFTLTADSFAEGQPAPEQIQRSTEREGCPPDALRKPGPVKKVFPGVEFTFTIESITGPTGEPISAGQTVALLTSGRPPNTPTPKKPRPDLIPAASLIEAGWCMAGGLERDDPNGQPWYETAPPAEARRKYHRSMLRHVLDWYAGNMVDADSKRSPLAHIICNAAILLSLELRGK